MVSVNWTWLWGIILISLLNMKRPFLIAGAIISWAEDSGFYKCREGTESWRAFRPLCFSTVDAMWPQASSSQDLDFSDHPCWTGPWAMLEHKLLSLVCSVLFCFVLSQQWWKMKTGPSKEPEIPSRWRSISGVVTMVRWNFNSARVKELESLPQCRSPFENKICKMGWEHQPHSLLCTTRKSTHISALTQNVPRHFLPKAWMKLPSRSL